MNKTLQPIPPLIFPNLHLHITPIPNPPSPPPRKAYDSSRPHQLPNLLCIPNLFGDYLVSWNQGSYTFSTSKFKTSFHQKITGWMAVQQGV